MKSMFSSKIKMKETFCKKIWSWFWIIKSQHLKCLNPIDRSNLRQNYYIFRKWPVRISAVGTVSIAFFAAILWNFVSSTLSIFPTKLWLSFSSIKALFFWLFCENLQASGSDSFVFDSSRLTFFLRRIIFFAKMNSLKWYYFDTQRPLMKKIKYVIISLNFYGIFLEFLMIQASKKSFCS